MNSWFVSGNKSIPSHLIKLVLSNYVSMVINYAKEIWNIYLLLINMKILNKYEMIIVKSKDST